MKNEVIKLKDNQTVAEYICDKRRMFFSTVVIIQDTKELNKYALDGYVEKSPKHGTKTLFTSVGYDRYKMEVAFFNSVVKENTDVAFVTTVYKNNKKVYSYPETTRVSYAVLDDSKWDEYSKQGQKE